MISPRGTKPKISNHPNRWTKYDLLKQGLVLKEIIRSCQSEQIPSRADIEKKMEVDEEGRLLPPVHLNKCIWSCLGIYCCVVTCFKLYIASDFLGEFDL